MIRSILESFKQFETFKKNTIVVQLNGLIHTDDSLAIESITSQLDMMDAEAMGKIFSSFAENLLYLLDCLKTGDRNKSKSVLFILEEFDLFCSHHNQTLLYNLFDIAQSAQAPICVLGSTCRLDAIELLEKRVKSRFSHRQFFLFPNNDFETRLNLFKKLLSADHTNKVKRLQYNDLWNLKIVKLVGDKNVQAALESHFAYETSIASLKKILYQLVSLLSDDHEWITPLDIKLVTEKYENDTKVDLLCDLSVLEICLVIAIKHHCEIYDRDPFNFEMILTRFNKFACKSGVFQNHGREVVMKGFERIQQFEFIMPVVSAGSNLLKQFQMYWLVLSFGQINVAISKYDDLPTEIDQWSKSSLV